MNTAPEGEASRTVNVDLSQDSVLDSATGVNQVVVNHSIDQAGALFVLTSQDGKVRRRLVQDIVSQQSAEYRVAHPDIAVDPHSELLNWVPKDKRREAYVLQQHILDVVDGRLDTAAGLTPSEYDCETTTPTQRRRAKEQELGITDDKLGRQIRTWQKQGPLLLVPHATRALTRSGAKGVPPEILAVVRHWARDRHLASQKTLINEHALVLDELRRLGLVSRVEGTVREDGTAVPYERDVLSYDSFVRQIRHLSRGRTPRTAKTRQQQSKRPKVTSVRHRGFDFGDRIEVDSTLTDIHVWTPDGPVRLWAVFAICVSTRYCWLRLVPEAPRGIHLGLLLFDMLGGEAFTTGGPGEQFDVVPNIPATIDLNAWPGPGKPPMGVLPGCIAADHGAEEENSYFIGFCAQLGIQLLWARTMSPADKSFVESHIRKFASACQLLPGHKGNTVENRPFRLDPEPPTFQQARAAFRHWSQWQANQPHTGLPHNPAQGKFLTPMEAVGISMTRGVPLRVLSDPTLALRLLPHVSLTPQDDGITWGKRRYTGHHYEDVIAASLDIRGRRSKMTFYYDPDAPHRLYWPQTRTFLVRTFSAPGPDSGIAGAFSEVREALEKHLAGQKWPSKNEWAGRRADLLATMRTAWDADGLDAEVVDLSKLRNRKRETSDQDQRPHQVFDNLGWEFDDLVDFTDKYADDFADDPGADPIDDLPHGSSGTDSDGDC